MHPLLARRGLLAFYLLLWLLVGVLFATIVTDEAGLPWGYGAAIALPPVFVFAFVCLSAWYVSRGLPLAGTGTVRIVATALTAAGLSSAIWLAFGRAWIAVLGSRVDEPVVEGVFARLAVPLFGFGVLLYLLSLAVAYVLVVFEASRDAERRGLEARVLAREAQLRSLRAQIDPHFLFNSLHSISALTTAEPAGARRMCLLLAEFLRESLALGMEDRIPLARELALIDRFLAVERVRFGDRLRVEIAAGDAGGALVPALILQPIVENAVTHGIAHRLDGGIIRIAAGLEGAMVRITIENPCDPDRPRGRGTGTGLSNVRARLRALHGPDAVLTAGETGELWRVVLTLPVVVGEIPERAGSSRIP